MELLRDFLAFIDENFDTFSGLDVRNEEGFSIVSFSDIGEEKESGMCVFYPVSITKEYEAESPRLQSLDECLIYCF